MLDHLDIDEMLALTASWVEPSQTRDVFLSVPEIAPLHPKVVQTHQALVASKTARAPQNELKALLEEETVVDARHDHLARGIHLAFESHMHFLLGQDPPDFARAATCQLAQRKLFPTGLTIVNASLLAESGNTARVGRMLRNQEKGLADFLATVPALEPNKTLRDMVDAWIEAGTALAELEHKRSSLMLKEGAMAPASSPQAAKRAWNRIVSQVLLTLGVSDASPDVVHALRAPFEGAVERTSMRFSGSRVGDEATLPE
ncbi:MAG: hypothetical protein IPM54_36745 [Polyangiaceae bacterium]|nr:hypothetical protein [Polyangiaceae bacterium]